MAAAKQSPSSLLPASIGEGHHSAAEEWNCMERRLSITARQPAESNVCPNHGLPLGSSIRCSIYLHRQKRLGQEKSHSNALRHCFWILSVLGAALRRQHLVNVAKQISISFDLICNSLTPHHFFFTGFRCRYTFDPASLYEQMGPTEIALTQLLAYLSSCCNPITYCFMNEKFRNAFLSAFGCGPQGRGFGRAPNRSTDLLSASFNDSFNLGRRTTNKGK